MPPHIPTTPRRDGFAAGTSITRRDLIIGDQKPGLLGRWV